VVTYEQLDLFTTYDPDPADPQPEADEGVEPDDEADTA
jgi:hypothetical protein